MNSNDDIDLYENIGEDDFVKDDNNDEDAYDDSMDNKSGGRNQNNSMSEIGSGTGNGQPAKKVALYVGNFTWWTTDQDLINKMATIGVADIVEIKFHENRQNGQSKGFCVVVVGSDQSAKDLMDKLPKLEIHGQNPVVTNCNKNSLQYFESQAGSIRRDGDSDDGRSGRNGGGDRGGGDRGMGGGRMRNQNTGGMMGQSGGLMGQPPMHQQQHMMRRNQQPPPMMPMQAAYPPRMMSGPMPGMPPRMDMRQGGMMQGMPPRPMMMPGQPPMGGPQHMMPANPGMMMNAGGHMNPAFMNQQSGAPPPVSQSNPSVQPPSAPGQHPPHLDMFGRPMAPGFQPPADQQMHNSGQQAPGTQAQSQQQPSQSQQQQQQQQQLSDSDIEDILTRNKTVSSSAISRAVQDAAAGDYAAAIETLVTAISLIKQSKIANDDRCKILINSLQDTLHGIESKSYGSKQRTRESRRRRSYSRSGSEPEQEERTSKRSRSRSRGEKSSRRRDRYDRYEGRSYDRERSDRSYRH